MNISDSQLRVLLHTLGILQKKIGPTRNYFLAGRGHQDISHLYAMVNSGIMQIVETPKFVPQDSIVFAATDFGISVAMKNLPEDPKKTKKASIHAE